jgi:hypothetical protein
MGEHCRGKLDTPEYDFDDKLSADLDTPQWFSPFCATDQRTAEL